MRNFLIICCIGMSVCWVTGITYAQQSKETQQDAQYTIDTDNIRYESSPVNKFGRGLINAATCWLEVPAEVYRVAKEKGNFVGGTLGLLQGVCSTLLRAATGVVDVATFIIPPYNHPLIQPEYAYRDLENRYYEYSRGQ